jgi:hypothetical protein
MNANPIEKERIQMSTGELAARIIISIIIVGPSLYIVAYTAHKTFMPQERFKEFAFKQTRFSRKIFKWHEPNIKLMRGVYIFGFVLGIICMLVAFLGAYVFWNQ